MLHDPDHLGGGAEKGPAGQLRENPGISLGPPGHHNKIGAGLGHEAAAVLRRHGIARGDHRHRHRLFDGSDDAPVRLSGIILLPGTAVDTDCIGAGRHRHACKLHRIDMLGIQAGTELHRHGHRNCFLHRFNDGSGPGQIPHEGAAFPVAGHLGHRTAHVDVDGRAFGLQLQGDFCPLGQHMGLGAEDLDDAGGMVVGDGHHPGSLAVPVQQRLGADHLGIGQSRPGLAAHGAEGPVGDSGHGSQEPGVVHRNVEKLHPATCQSIRLVPRIRSACSLSQSRVKPSTWAWMPCCCTSSSVQRFRGQTRYSRSV